MAQEIERKFLVNGSSFKSLSERKVQIIQGYLCSAIERTVRIRIHGAQGYITIKGKGNASGATRYEWEKEISLTDAKELLELCEPGIIDKTRYYIKVGNFTFEIDEFHGNNEGLIIAEIELPSENTIFEHPAFLGEEVTGISKYYNSAIIKNPYKNW